MSAVPTRDMKKSERTRLRILDSAAYMLSVKGYARLRMSDVAEHAETHGPAIYYYFASRDALVAEVLAAGVRGMRENLSRVLADLPASVSPLDRVLIATEQHLRYVLQMSHYPRASIRNSGQIPMELRAKQLEEEATYGELWKQLVEDVGSDVDTAMVRRLILGGLSWTAEWWDFERGDVDRVVAAARDMVRKALL
ncbi:MAG TPA: TetR/AcrR family transcriptional regulator [Nocardioidaceae bacterium]|nr:TetR/AcrR family transcriptional regulator [Nocardioidaceae bacterium]